MDGWANPLLVEALGRSREGLVDVTGAADWAPPLPGLADPSQVLRWEPWVRLSLLQDELQDGLSVRPEPRSADTMEVRVGSRTLLTMARPDAAHFARELKQVLSLASLREDRAPEILAQIDGQWAFWAQLLPFRLVQTPTVVELMNLAIQFSVSVELRLKHAFACPRPHQLSHAVRPMITTPGHGTFPMGHATQVEAVRELLIALLDGVGWPVPGGGVHGGLPFAEVSAEWCARVAENRVVAGVHFPVDGVAGCFLGRLLGRHLVGALSGQRLLPPSTAKAPAFPAQRNGAPDGGRAEAVGQAARALEGSASASSVEGAPPAQAAGEPPAPVLLPQVWDKAVREVRVSLGLDPDAR